MKLFGRDKKKELEAAQEAKRREKARGVLQTFITNALERRYFVIAGVETKTLVDDLEAIFTNSKYMEPLEQRVHDFIAHYNSKVNPHGDEPNRGYVTWTKLTWDLLYDYYWTLNGKPTYRPYLPHRPRIIYVWKMRKPQYDWEKEHGLDFAKERFTYTTYKYVEEDDPRRGEIEYPDEEVKPQ